MLITLTTDFGTQDAYVGLMKAVILTLAPQVRLVDLTHELAPGDVRGAAVLLDDAVDYFPPNTVHLAVVDPGVGGPRAALAVETDRFFLVGPDNGLFGPILERYPPRRLVHLTNPAFHRQPTSATFHGRDIFAPAAAHLALARPIEQLGRSVQKWQTLNLPRPQISSGGLIAHVLRVDRFGNLITNLRRQELDRWRGRRPLESLILRIGRRTLRGIRRTYSDVPRGELVAYIGSTERLEIAVHGGDAARHLAVKPDQPVMIRCSR